MDGRAEVSEEEEETEEGAGQGLGPGRRERHAIGDRAERTDGAPEMQVSPAAVVSQERSARDECPWGPPAAQASPSWGCRTL